MITAVFSRLALLGSPANSGLSARSFKIPGKLKVAKPANPA
jgi:hypothetical protein